VNGRSAIRNRTLARVFEKIGMVEGWGSGLKRIIAMSREYGIEPPEFLEIGDLLRVNFYRPSYKNDKTIQETSLKFNDSQKLIVAYIRKTPAATRAEMAQDIAGITEDGIKYNLKILQKNNVIKHVGSTKKGQWIVTGAEE
jgi:ATP-dependent DNA helicase RecG